MNVLEFTLDRLDLASVIKTSDLGLELIGHEVVAAAWLPACVCHMVHRGHAVSSELEGSRRCQPVDLGKKEVGFRQSHKAVRHAFVDAGVVVPANVDPSDESYHTMGVVYFEALVGQFVSLMVKGGVHVACEETLCGYPVLRELRGVELYVLPQLCQLFACCLALVSATSEFAIGTEFRAVRHWARGVRVRCDVICVVL